MTSSKERTRRPKLRVVKPLCETCGGVAFYRATFTRGKKSATLRLCLRCDMTARLIHASLGGKPVETARARRDKEVG